MENISPTITERDRRVSHPLRTDRSLAESLFLGILTIGIYDIVQMTHISNEINKIAKGNGKETSGFLGMCLVSLLIISTATACIVGAFAGTSIFLLIVSIVLFLLSIFIPLQWHYVLTKRVENELKRRSLTEVLSTTDFWDWFFFGSLLFGIGQLVFFSSLLRAMNLLCESYNKELFTEETHDENIEKGCVTEVISEESLCVRDNNETAENLVLENHCQPKTIIDGTEEITIASESETEICKAGKSTSSKYKKAKVVLVTCGGILLLISTIFLIIHYSSKSSNHVDYWASYSANSSDIDEEASENYDSQFNERKIRDVIGAYCRAIADNDFETLNNVYASHVERFQDARDKDREYVIGCHKRYDEKFKVLRKYSSLRWETFTMSELASGDRVGVSIVEEYSIDRKEQDKYSMFVLEKHFVLNKQYQIVSVYDVQLEKYKASTQTIDNKRLATESFDFLQEKYLGNHQSLYDVGKVYGKVDFRKNGSFAQLIKNIVQNEQAYQTMMSSNVISTEFSDGCVGKVEIFEIKGETYSITYVVSLGAEFNITVKVGDKEYNWVSPGYFSTVKDC